MSRKKKKQAKPDEEFISGPLRIARYGSNIFWESNWPEGAFAEWQRSSADQLPNIVAEIDRLVDEIAGIVSRLPAKDLLFRARAQMASRHLVPKTEDQLDSDDGVALRMIDYVQSVIAAVPPAAQQNDEVSDDDWNALRTGVEDLFRKVGLDYQILLANKNRLENPDIDEDLERFKFEAQLYWCNVRGHRYQVHDPVYLKDMFLPHAAVLEELFGLSGEQFVGELTKLWHNHTFGLGDVMQDLKTFQRDTMDALESRWSEVKGEDDIRRLMDEVVRANGWEERRDSILGRFLGADLYDVEKVTALPSDLLDDLSWSPGQEDEFFAEGEYRGWPLRIWPVFKRPFICLDGRYYCFDLFSLFDNIYRVMQRIILRRKPNYRETWNRTQQGLSEGLPLDYLQRVLPGSDTTQSVYYRWKTEAGAVGWCEADGLLVYDDHLFIVECRGGAFTYTPPATDFPAYIASLENLVLKPANQGKRFLDYLGSTETVKLYDENHEEIGQLRSDAFRHITICAVTLDPFTELAARTQHLRRVGVDVGEYPVWSISLDDLRVFADVFSNPLIFLHFIEQRARAFQSDAVECNDELDHIGLYLKHNHYASYAEELKEDGQSNSNFLGYRSDIDKFFTSRLQNPEAPCPLVQEMPKRIVEIVDHLTKIELPGRSLVASYVLDLSGNWRDIIDSGIGEELERQKDIRRAKPLSTHNGPSITLFCWQAPRTERDKNLAVEHARVVSLVHNDESRLLLELTYGPDDKLEAVSWQWVKPALFPEPLRTKLQTKAEALRRTRVVNARRQRRKIGRNEQCPCGSGKKYKKCCIDVQ